MDGAKRVLHTFSPVHYKHREGGYAFMPEQQQHDDYILDPTMAHVTHMYCYMFISALGFYLFLDHFWNDYILFSFKDMTVNDGLAMEGMGSVWFLFVWGVGFTLVANLFRRTRPRIYDPRTALIKGAWFSLNAGVFEELIYRWLAFFSAMAVLSLANFLSFGLVGWAFETIILPVVNWITLGKLDDQLVLSDSWTIGAAIVVASVSFYNAHAYLGVIGQTNSWFIAMIMFYLAFNYGIVTAIVTHVLYDMLIFAAFALTYRWHIPETTKTRYMH